MEVIRSSFLTFNSNDSGRGSSEPNSSRGVPYKKTRSPFEPKSISGGTTKFQPTGQSISPIKGLPLESPMRQNLILPPPTNISPHLAELHGNGKELRGTKDTETPASNSTSPTKKRISPSDSGIDLLSKESPALTVSPTKINPKLRTMYNTSRRDLDESTEFSVNPDPVPYQPSNFMSSTVLKKVPVTRRHLDSFGVGGVDLSASLGKRGVMLHTDRYHWDLAKALDGLSQRERLQAELEYMERLRGIKRRREVLPHRAQLDLLMGGKKVEFSERFEIQKEIQKLKSLILPQHAKDLFHGRGFTLPENHNSVKPRRILPTDIDLEEDLGPFPPDKYSFNPETGRVVPKTQKQTDASQQGMFPRINNKGYLLGGSSNSPYMRRSKTNVTSGQIRQPAPNNARSVTAVPNKKEGNLRTTVTAPTLKTGAAQSPGREIKIPVSSRDPEEVEPEPSPGVPKHTPATTVEKNRSIIMEEPNEMDIVLEEWPGVDAEDTQLTQLQTTRETTREGASRMSATSPTKAPTPNPLKGIDLPTSISVEQQAQLKQTFNKLDTDKDGHLMFNQLQTQLPKQFTQAQEKYIKQVYEITSSSTFFGLDEFMTMSYLTNVVTGLQGDALDAFNKLNFHNLHEVILKYVELYQTVDRAHKGKITLHSLQDILSTTLSTDFKLDPQKWNKISDALSLDISGHVTKIEFLAHIPYFQTMSKST